MSSIPTYVFDLLHPDLVDISKYKFSGYGQAIYPGTSTDRIDQPCPAWQEMAEDWDVVRFLRGGTRGMRLAAEKFLPKFPKESQAEWESRLNTSFSVDWLDDTLDEMISKPFTKAIVFEGTVPDWVYEFNKDVDGRGTTMDEFAREYLYDAMSWGKSHAVVDGVGLPEDIPKGALLGEFDGARPRVRLVKGPNALSWEFDQERMLSEVRYYERLVDSEIKEYVHVLTATGSTEWKRDYREYTWKRGAVSSHMIEEVPLVTLYVKKSGEMSSRPPFMDIAWLCIDWWQSYSDQRQILHTGRVPILFRKGFDENEEKRKGQAAIGARRIVTTPNTEAEMRYVEVQGAAMLEGREHLKMLWESAKEKSSKPLRSKSPVTATGEIHIDSKSTCDLQAWAEATERALDRIYRLAQRASPGLAPLADDFRARIYKDFDLRDRNTTDLAGLRMDRDRGDISRDAFMREVVRRGVLPEQYDIEEDGKLVEKEQEEKMQQAVDQAAAMAEVAPKPAPPAGGGPAQGKPAPLAESKQ